MTDSIPPKTDAEASEVLAHRAPTEAPEHETTPRRNRYDKDGSERPRFIFDFPSDPELDRLVQAFEAGNFAYVRKEAPLLAARSESPEVRAAAAELRRRIDPDKTVVILLGVAVLFLSLLVLWVYVGQHRHG